MITRTVGDCLRGLHDKAGAAACWLCDNCAKEYITCTPDFIASSKGIPKPSAASIERPGAGKEMLLGRVRKEAKESLSPAF
jgi:hypothetical protein